LVGVGVAVAASNTSTIPDRPSVPDRNAAAISITQNGSTTHITVSCDDPTRRLACIGLAGLREEPLERCLQIWGGPERAVIHLPNAKPILVTRTNSCGIARWAELQKQLR
jgi:hypothetical protein